MTLDGNVARKDHGTPRNYRIYKVYGCESLNFRATILFILRSALYTNLRQEAGNFKVTQVSRIATKGQDFNLEGR